MGDETGDQSNGITTRAMDSIRGDGLAMATITMKVPDTLRDQAQDLANEMGYQSMSEYVRTALREKIEEDLVKSRLQDNKEMITLEEARDLVNAADDSENSPKINEGSKKSNTKAKTTNP